MKIGKTDRKRKRVTVSMPAFVIRAIDELARKHNRDRSKEVCHAIEQYLVAVDRQRDACRPMDRCGTTLQGGTGGCR